MRAVFHEVFLPYPEEMLLRHFVETGVVGEEPERHLTRWRKRVADAPGKDPSYLHRDETLWTAGALLAIHYADNALDRWPDVMVLLFGAIPPTAERLEWEQLLASDLELFFEVGLGSPQAYRQ